MLLTTQIKSLERNLFFLFSRWGGFKLFFSQLYSTTKLLPTKEYINFVLHTNTIICPHTWGLVSDWFFTSWDKNINFLFYPCWLLPTRVKACQLGKKRRLPTEYCKLISIAFLPKMLLFYTSHSPWQFTPYMMTRSS